MIVRLATVQDLSALSDVCARTFKETYGNRTERLDRLVHEYVQKNFNPDTLGRDLDHPGVEIWIVLLENQVSGYLKLARAPAPESLRGKKLMHLERIYILREAKGRGLGKSLMAKAEERANAEAFVGLWLSVWEENLEALEFYRRLGYQKAGLHDWEFEHDGYRYTDIDHVLFKETV